jgi:hypothetical protein
MTEQQQHHNNKRKYTSYADNDDDLIILEESKDDFESKRSHYLSYTDRYFKRFYNLNVRYPNNDHLILMHTNKVAVCTIAPSHPLLNSSKYKINKIEFIQNVNEQMSGKHKHKAKNVNFLQPLCRVICTDLQPEQQNEDKKDEDEEKTFIIYCSLNAKLLEINERLIENPNLLQTKSSTEGYLVILMPKLDDLKDQLSKLITHEDYLKTIKQG